MERIRTRLSEIFSTPGRQAVGWAALGAIGLLLALGGTLLMLDGGGSKSTKSDGAGRATATATRPGGSATATASASPSPSATGSPTATASPSPTVSPSPTATATPARQQSGSTSGGSDSAPPPPTATPTPPPVAAGGPYCNNGSSTAPPNSSIGLLTIGGAPAPAGTVVTILFDGVAGPSMATKAAGGYRVDWSAGGEGCANRVGAAMAVSVNGQTIPTSFTVGSMGGSPLYIFDVAVP